MQFLSKKVVIFGSSMEGRNTAKVVRTYGVEPVLFIDNSQEKWGTEILEIPVAAPEALHSMENYIVIVPSMYYKPMRAQLREMGIARGLIYHFAVYHTDPYFYDMPYKLRFYLLANKWKKRTIIEKDK